MSNPEELPNLFEIITRGRSLTKVEARRLSKLPPAAKPNLHLAYRMAEANALVTEWQIAYISAIDIIYAKFLEFDLLGKDLNIDNAAFNYANAVCATLVHPHLNKHTAMVMKHNWVKVLSASEKKES